MDTGSRHWWRLPARRTLCPGPQPRCHLWRYRRSCCHCVGILSLQMNKRLLIKEYCEQINIIAGPNVLENNKKKPSAMSIFNEIIRFLKWWKWGGGAKKLSHLTCYYQYHLFEKLCNETFSHFYFIYRPLFDLDYYNFHTREFVIYSYTICCFLWTNNFLAFVNVVFIIFTVLIVPYMYTW